MIGTLNHRDDKFIGRDAAVLRLYVQSYVFLDHPSEPELL